MSESTTPRRTQPTEPARLALGTVSRTREMLVDSWIITLRNLTYWLRSPEAIMGGLSFPVVSVLLFGYVFGNAMTVPGGGEYREFLMPGLFTMTMVLGLVITATAVVEDNARGVTDRFRSMPIAPAAVVTGRAIADMVRGCVDLVVMLACGALAGWSAPGGVGPALAAVGLLLLLRFALIWAGIYLGLHLRSPEGATTLLPLVLPFAMIANTFVAPELMPNWLGFVAELNPMSSTVAATRELFGNPGTDGQTWIAEHPVFMALVWPLVLIAVLFPLSVRRYRKLAR